MKAGIIIVGAFVLWVFLITLAGAQTNDYLRDFDVRSTSGGYGMEVSMDIAPEIRQANDRVKNSEGIVAKVGSVITWPFRVTWDGLSKAGTAAMNHPKTSLSALAITIVTALASEGVFDDLDGSSSDKPPPLQQVPDKNSQQGSGNSIIFKDVSSCPDVDQSGTDLHFECDVAVGS